MGLQNRVQAVHARLKKAMAHAYVDAHIRPRTIDQDRLLFSLAMLDDANVVEQVADDYVFAMMLIQIALDTHDEVDERTSMHERQLIVLAGDLYSGLYYEFLSQRGDVSLIYTFSRAIKEINVQKIRLNHLQKEDAEWFHCLGVIESALVSNLASYVRADQWDAFAYYFFSLKRLQTEEGLSVASAHYVDHCKRKLADFAHRRLHDDVKQMVSALLAH